MGFAELIALLGVLVGLVLPKKAGEVSAVVDVAGRLLALAKKAKDNAARTGEWTSAERAAVEARYQEQIASKAFLTDEEGG